MRITNPKFACILWLLVTAGLGEPGESQEIRFSQDVLPVLSDRCFHCHGPDESNREADLRLDLEESAKQELGGYQPISPGSLEHSEVWQRIISDDEDVRMPPTASHRKPLTARERAAIRQWIQQGARWGKHWAFEPPIRPRVPDIAIHPIDAFVQQRLADKGLHPSDVAEPHSQLRRLAFALTGLSPQPETVRSFSRDTSETAWAEQVDRLLESPQHAERMTMWWLDAARYSDSDGYQQDETRENWPWRDWVINAFASNMPFDQFTTEQFAGDLLPQATPEQILATCFHRNHMTNGEGGRDAEESRIDYVIDRVNTIGTVWMGLTLGCVQCHSHKFDPISQADYYSMTAFFNSIDETGKAGFSAGPYLEYASDKVGPRIREQKDFLERLQQEHDRQLTAAKLRFEDWLAELASIPHDSYRTWRTPQPRITSSEGTSFTTDEQNIVQTGGPTPFHDDYRVEFEIPPEMHRVTGWRLEVFPHKSHVNGRFTRQADGEFVLTSVRLLRSQPGSPTEEELELTGTKADFEPASDRDSQRDLRYGKISKTLNDDARDGWTTESAEKTEKHVGVFELAEPLPTRLGDKLIVVLRHRSTSGNANTARFRIGFTSEPGETVRRVDGGSPIADWFSELESKQAEDGAKPEAALAQRLLEQFLLVDPAYREVRLRLDRAQRQLNELQKKSQPQRVMVLKERDQPRPTHVLVRGVWDEKGEEVAPSVLPGVLDWPEERALSRLDLANWLVSPEHPLTARVIVNQLWQICFGTGLVRTPEDFGLQGELPTHPQLLDWLAVELVENNWDLRHVLRLIVTSQTFRQSSHSTATMLEVDPQNRWLARAPKFRLPAWMLRDNALLVSGLLNPAIGGPPIKPYQPEGIWSEITMGRFHYDPSLGPAQYRRTVYAFWRRSSAPAFLFDTAQRRVCEVGLRKTNTPLQALTLMNDTTLLEASRALADTTQDEFSREALQHLALKVLSRELKEHEAETLAEVWSRAADYYRNHMHDAATYTAVGQHPAPPASQAVVTAAWMSVASLLLNLDEAMAYE